MRKITNVRSQRVEKPRYRSIFASYRTNDIPLISEIVGGSVMYRPDEIVKNRTHRQEDIAKVHEHVNDRPYPRKVHDVASDNKRNGQDVMGKHLPMVVPTFFGVDHVDLMIPPTELSEVVEFGK